MRAPLALPLLLAAQMACASAGQSWRAGPAGIPAERQIRWQLASGQSAAALQSLKDRKVAPADALLRHLYKGVIALHAGQPELGTRALDRAWEISQDRYTKRVGDGAQALLTGDGALPYDVGTAERVLIPFYGGLNWMARNEVREVGVEARRMAQVLESDAGQRPEARYRGVMRYVNGVLFEVAGERNDAEVAYRNAAVLLEGRLPGDTLPPDAAHGDVVVLIEDGFVSRPEPAALDFWVNDAEVTALQSDDLGVRMSTYDRVNGRRGVQRDWRAERYRNVSLRWPQMAGVNPDAASGVVGARATALGGAAALDSAAQAEGAVLPATVPVEADVISVRLSDAVRADWERDQPGRIARALARAAVREATAKGAGSAFEAAGDVLTGDEDKDDSAKGGKGSKKDDDEGASPGAKAAVLILAGIGLLALHVGSQVLDQPDLRAWQVLPDRVSVARMRLPVGEHVIEVTRDGESYSLGAVTVRPGSVTVLVKRWFPVHGAVVAQQ
ncbi:MAG: hypothetical protein K1X31_03675 [Gemmatimonadaceae bacterium]|nr:hypothetical protein [Gemmatimonadaceae bacterium]